MGRASIGSAGSLVDSMVDDAGNPRSKLWIRNVVRCRPHRKRPPRACAGCTSSSPR